MTCVLKAEVFGGSSMQYIRLKVVNMSIVVRPIAAVDSSPERFSIQYSSRVLIVQRSANARLGKWYLLGSELDALTYTGLSVFSSNSKALIFFPYTSTRASREEELFDTSVDEKILSERIASCINVGMASVQLALRCCLSNCLISLVFSALKFRARLIFGPSRVGLKCCQPLS